MKTFERYLAREIYAGTALVLAAFLALFAFFDLINELKDVGQAGYQLQHALLFVLLTVPGRVYELMPVAVLIGTLYALVTLARHSEITVLRSAGLSTGRALRTLAKIGSVFVVLIFLVGEFVAPPAERLGQQLRLKAMGSVVGQEFRSGLWVKDEKSFINVQTVLPDTRLKGIRIYEFDDNYALRSISEAAEGEYIPHNRWRLTGVVQTVFENNRASVVRTAEVEWQSALSPDILSVLLLKPERMSVVNLYLYIRHLSENNLKTQRYQIAAWKKIIYPLASLVMMALALPFAYLQDRMGAVSVKVFAGIMLGITFHTLNGLFSNLGIINSWPPFFSAITPSLLFLLAAATMLWRSERR
ncbi:MAG: LPS export ABC transporter permease LptG [Pseudomonadota bacterium]